MKLRWQSQFKRALKKQVKLHPDVLDEVQAVLAQLEQDPFAPNLRTHKLQGQMAGQWSCSVAYDLRIIFTFAPDLDDPKEQAIALLNIGKHDEVY
jgi:mRNA interferase YafQ